MALAVVAVLAGSVSAASVTFHKVVDDLTPMPGTAITFFLYPTPPALNSGKVIFASQTSAGRALWRATVSGKSLAKIVDSNTPIPGGSGNFGDVFPFRYQGSRVVFHGNDDGVHGQAGYYSALAKSGTAITTLVDQNTAIPEGSGTFGAPTLSSNFNVDKGVVLFQALGGPKIFAVKSKGGPVTGVSHLDIGICETGAFFGLWVLFLAPDASGGTVAAAVGDVASNAAIYTFPRSGLVGVADSCASPSLKATNATRIASHNVAVPDDPSSRNFDALGFNFPVIDGGAVVFAGSARNGSGQIDLQGIYSSIKGTLTRLVDTNTAVPCGTGNFQLGGLGPYTVSKGNVVFRGIDGSNHSGLYLVKASGGPITKIIAHGDLLGDADSRFADNFQSYTIQPDSLRGTKLVFVVDAFIPPPGNGTNHAIYTTTVKANTTCP